jgi:hypothetical protein
VTRTARRSPGLQTHNAAVIAFSGEIDLAVDLGNGDRTGISSRCNSSFGHLRPTWVSDEVESKWLRGDLILRPSILKTSQRAGAKSAAAAGLISPQNGVFAGKVR